MNGCSLTLIPYGKQPITIELLENKFTRDSIEQTIENSTKGGNIFSDLSYEFVLNCEDISAIQDVRIYVNDVYEKSTYVQGKVRFPDKNSGDRRIFGDCYGFAMLNLTLVMDDGTERKFRSEYLSVLVRRGELNAAVKAMTNYVYQHQDVLLLNGEPKPKDMAGLKDSRYNSLMTRIILAREIAIAYESSYGFFKANSRFKVEKKPIIDRFERLQYISSATLQYVAIHPEQLSAVCNNSGIRVRGHVYQPQKTLFMKSECSYDIYENRVILSFLRKMIDEVAKLQEKSQQLLHQIPNNEDYSHDYIYSSFFMFAETKKSLEDGISQLSELQKRFHKLWSLYRGILTIQLEPIPKEPKPTAIFISVPQYNKIFVRIHQWFRFGIYDFAKEKFMLSFIKISSLYEGYLLAKIIVYLQDRGYTLRKPAGICKYPVKDSWKYKNTICNNTFIFDGGNKQVTLYYQPVVFDVDKTFVNGIGLYRNNSIPVDDDDDKGGHYYVPDYILKIDNKQTVKYLIIDAKFSDIIKIRRYYVKDLAFKYLFSISAVKNEDAVAGMCIIYGKCTASEQIQSVYDSQLNGCLITPFAETLPLIESVASDGQYDKLDLLFRKVLE